MPNSKSSKPVFSTKELAYLAMTVAAATVGRMVFQLFPLPNVQPMTAIFLIITMQLGIYRGLIICLLSILLTNLSLGMGVWTLAQLFSYACLISLVGVLRHFKWYRKHKLFQIVVSVFCGFMYGFIISIISVNLYGMTSFWAYYLQGVAFDLFHALGNGFFYMMLAPVFATLLKRIEIGNASV